MTKKAHSITMLNEAIDSLGFTLSSQDIHRLHYFTRDVATRTATVKALRNAVAQFRLDPLKLLEKRGVGIKTLQSVKALSDLLAGQETQKEFGVADNLAAVQSILNTTHRGVNDVVRGFIASANSHLTHARNAIQMDKMGEVVPAREFQDGDITLREYCGLTGDDVTIMDVAGNVAVVSADLEYAARTCVEKLKARVAKRYKTEGKRYDITFIQGEFTESNDAGDQGVYLCVRMTIRENLNEHTPRFEN